jgi:CRP/FNR family transcriptional regulator, anaerobic regulatory protein
MINFLKKQGLTEAQVAELLANSETLHVKKRDILLREKEIGQHIYFVKSGILRAGIHDEEAKDWTHFFYSSEGLKWAGLSSNALLQKPSDYFIEVLEDAEIIAFDLVYFQQLRRANLAWARFFNCQLMTVFNYLENRTLNQLKYSPEKRYLAFIETYPKIAQSIPQHYIANYIGVVPESLSRIRKRLNDSVIFN